MSKTRYFIAPRSFSPGSTGRFLTSRGAWVVVLTLFLLAALAVFDDYGVSWDELVQHNIAILNADYISGKNDDLVRHRDRMYGAAFELPLLLAERLLELEDTRTIYLSRHLLTHLFFLLGAACCYLLAVRLFNNRILALAAMLLFLLHPRLYAHSFFNSKDIPFFSMFMIALFLIHRTFARDTVRAFLLCGAAVAVLINLRITGVMLLLAVVGMRGLDAWYASDRQERMQVLKTLGGFILSSVLVLYAIWPYLWEDPLGRLMEAITIASRFPHESPELFKGTFINSFDLPWEYIPTWFLITTPWVALLLGFIGIVAVGYRGLIQPRKILRNTPVRFQWLLLACFVLPAVAAIVFNFALYDGWRHMYFLYAPFCLLAAYGLHWLISSRLVSLSRKKYWGVGVYALAGIGLVVVVIEMVQIHPYQNVYFNALVDRHTPGYLRTQYEMEYWGTSYREGLEYLVEHYPDSPIYFYGKDGNIKRNRTILPATERQRFVFNPARADVYLVRHYHQRAWQGRKLPKAVKPLYTIKVYNNVILAVYAVNLDFLDESSQALYRGIYQKIKTREPVIHSVFDIYEYEDKLVYIKESCNPNDLWEHFFVHILPVNETDLPGWRKRYGFENRDFSFYMHGVRFDGKCMAVVPLPEYEISSIRIGQFFRDKPAWKATFLPQRKQQRLMAKLADLPQEIASGTPLIKAVFDVYRHQDTLVYIIKESCTESDTEARFLLHFEPFDVDDLSSSRQSHGFDNRDFNFREYGVHFDGRCMAVVPLPEYDIAKIHTGQFTNEGVVWEGKFSLKQD